MATTNLARVLHCLYGMRQRGFTAIEIAIALTLVAILLGGIAYPKLRRAMVAANESQAIGETRQVVVAEQAFASVNCGFFDDLPNLCRDGDECNGISIPGYPAGEPEFLGGDLGRRSPYTRSGYERSFEPHQRVADLRNHRFELDHCSPTSVLSYCYVSRPSSVGLTAQLGLAERSFASDETGSLHAFPKGEPVQCPVGVPCSLGLDGRLRPLWTVGPDGEYIH